MSNKPSRPGQSLPELLVAELSALKRFCALLGEERQVLSGAQADRLPDIAAEKTSLAGQLSGFESRREALLHEEGLPKGRAGIEAWLASRPDREPQRRQWAELLELARQARDENDTNGRLIGLLLQQNRDALSLLLSSGGADSIYSADGQPRSLAGLKRSLGAG